MTTIGRSDVGTGARRQKHNPLTRTKPLRALHENLVRQLALARAGAGSMTRPRGFGRLESAPGVGRADREDQGGARRLCRATAADHPPDLLSAGRRRRIRETEQAYKRLEELLNKARRARLIDMDAIRDDGFSSQLTTFFANAEAFINNAIAWTEELRLDRQKGQARRLVVRCEASGMVPQLARIADPYGIEVCSSGGFDSLTDKHRIGRLWAGRQAVTALHLGDHDPSGVHVFSSLAEDIAEFAADYGGDVEFVRVAVTPEQARQYNLPSAPRKATDRRSFDGDETWQCEALDPRTLAAILQAAIDERFDRDLYDQGLEEERETGASAASSHLNGLLPVLALSLCLVSRIASDEGRKQPGPMTSCSQSGGACRI